MRQSTTHAEGLLGTNIQGAFDTVCVSEKDDRAPSLHLHEDALDLAQTLKNKTDVGFEDVSR
jgi:hypothetical protein